MPMVMMAPMKDPDDLDEFDCCDICQAVTNLLVIVRVQSALVSLCGECIDTLKRGYEELLRVRLKAGYK